MSEENKSKSDWSKRDIGALWRRDGKNQKFLSGKITIGEFGEEKEIEIGGEKFFYEDKRNHYLIRDRINDLLTQDRLSGGGENDMESPEGDSEEPEAEAPDEEPAA